LSVNALHSSIGQNIKSLGVSDVRSLCEQDCDIIYGPIFTKFGTELLRMVH